MGLLRRFLKWCVTEDAKKKLSYVATGLISTVGVSHLVPQTVFVEYYVDFLHLYKNGFSVPLTEETKQKFEKVLDMLEVIPEYRNLYKPFNVVGFDVTSIGSSFSKWGVWVGIPGNFGFKNVTDIPTSRITLNGEKLLWESEAGKKMLKSLILSDNAQYYAIAREIKMRDTPKLFIDTFIGTSCAFATYALSNTINRKYDLFAKPLIVRVIMYMLVSAFTLGNYFLVKDFSQLHYEQSIDKELKEKSPVLAEGGKEFYTKALLRNMCLRILMGKEGEILYSPLGNENYFLRTKSTPLMQRREFFE